MYVFYYCCRITFFIFCIFVICVFVIFIVVIFAQWVQFHDKFKFNEDGYIIGCCNKHGKNGVEYGECENHPKSTILGTGKSFCLPGMNTKHDTFGLIMFHDHTWHDKSLSNHLCNDEIFITFPLNEIAWISGDIKTIYNKHEHPIKTAANDIKFLWPSSCTNVWLVNWNMRDSYQQCTPIIQDWYKAKTFIANRLKNHLKELEKTISESADCIKV